jgi:transcription initiation factor TFIIIB Brf1 subunit/transcription initiation factor TFIIB
MNGNRKIQEVAGMVRMSRRHCDIAERYYKLAVVHSFTKGRKVAVCAACKFAFITNIRLSVHCLST